MIYFVRKDFGDKKMQYMYKTLHIKNILIRNMGQ